MLTNTTAAHWADVLMFLWVGSHLWALVMTPASGGCVLVCPCQDGGTFRFDVSRTLQHIGIAEDAFKNPSAKANHQTN